MLKQNTAKQFAKHNKINKRSFMRGIIMANNFQNNFEAVMENICV